MNRSLEPGGWQLQASRELLHVSHLGGFLMVGAQKLRGQYFNIRPMIDFESPEDHHSRHSSQYVSLLRPCQRTSFLDLPRLTILLHDLDPQLLSKYGENSLPTKFPRMVPGCY